MQAAPRAPYQTPGTPRFAKKPLGPANSIVPKNPKQAAPPLLPQRPSLIRPLQVRDGSGQGQQRAQPCEVRAVAGAHESLEIISGCRHPLQKCNIGAGPAARPALRTRRVLRPLPLQVTAATKPCCGSLHVVRSDLAGLLAHRMDQDASASTEQVWTSPPFTQMRLQTLFIPHHRPSPFPQPSTHVLLLDVRDEDAFRSCR